jgi:hypothetical protein
MILFLHGVTLFPSLESKYDKNTPEKKICKDTEFCDLARIPEIFGCKNKRKCSQIVYVDIFLPFYLVFILWIQARRAYRLTCWHSGGRRRMLTDQLLLHPGQ